MRARVRPARRGILRGMMRPLLTLGALLAVAVGLYLVFGRGREIQGADARKLVAAGPMPAATAGCR